MNQDHPDKKIPFSLKSLFEVASLARKKAYAPYSDFQVGAAIRLSSGEVIGGANLENSSYGATICAERVALGCALMEVGPQFKITEVMIIALGPKAVGPCGICRQSLMEFADKNCKIYMSKPDGSGFEESTLEILFPKAFTRQELEDAGREV